MTTRHRVEIIVLLWVIVAGIFAAALTVDWMSAWGTLGVPALFPPFADLRSITGGIESSRLGADPLARNPGDPWARTMNYPRVWLSLFRALGIDDAKLFLVGALFSAAYLGCISLLIWRSRDPVVAVTIGICVLSGASLLAMERGNNDLLIFALVLGAVVSRSLPASAAAIGSAIVLKLYPVAAIVHFATAREKRRRAAAWALVVVALGILWVNARDLQLIAGGTPSSFRVSYGVLSLHAGCADVAARLPSIPGLCGGWLPSLGVALLACLALATACWAWRTPSRWRAEETPSRDADLFVTFAAIYVATYFTGSHWDYRLIFLVPTLPFLVSLAHRAPGRWLGWVSVLSIPLAMNAGMVGTGPFTYLGHLAKGWAAFACLFLLVTVSRVRLAAADGLAH